MCIYVCTCVWNRPFPYSSVNTEKTHKYVHIPIYTYMNAPPPQPTPSTPTVRLGAGSLLHIARAALPALAPSRVGERARALAVALLRRVIEGRVLAPMVGEGAQGASAALGALQVRGFVYDAVVAVSHGPWSG